MIQVALPHSRGPQILKLLAEHGPLSVRGLSQILKPKPDPTRLRESLQRLQRRKFVVKMYDKHYGGSGVLYKITQDDDHWKPISKIVGCNPQSLYQPQFHKKEHRHSELCGIWAEYLKRLFPEALVLRDYMFLQSDLAKNVLQSFGDEKEMLPDILLLFEKGSQNSTVSVAVEIERLVKSGRRIARKLKKFCNEARLDGVIYICDETPIAKRVRTIYNSRIRTEALTISNYGGNFLLFRNNVNITEGESDFTYNADLRYIKIYDWAQHLLRHELSARNDFIFDVQLSTPGKF